MTASEAPAWIEERRRSWSERQGVEWAVCGAAGGALDGGARAEAGAVLGRIAFPRLALRDGLAEVDYWVLPTDASRRSLAEIISSHRLSARGARGQK